MTLLATVATATVALTLLAAACAHARQPRRLAAALTEQAVVPASLTSAVTVAVITAEAGLGLAVAVGPTSPALAGAAALFTGYAGYTAYLRTRPGVVPCGCGDQVVVSGWVVGRAGTLAGLALLGLALTPAAPTAPAGEAAVALCAAATFACLLWQLPAAMAVPGQVAP